MVLTERDITLQECLQEIGRPNLPVAISEGYKKTWLRAICLVTKANGQQSYVLCDNDGFGKPIVKRDFGSCSVILRYDAIYPYDEANASIVPQLRNDAEIVQYLSRSKYNKAEVIALLSSEGKTKDQISADRIEISRMINDFAIETHKRHELERKRVDEIKAYAESVKKEKLTANGRGRKKKTS